ncbi:MAG TPA: excinuclease ABC subunit C [Rikenellaceae bacterium]|nr:excinuclease ABC subunit C [Rikenellaceae bacterium]
MDVKEKIALFPHSPGVYRYYNSEGVVIYVGKAKDLHKRVAQYFVPPERLNTKTRALVSKIADAQYSVVDSEADALLLENNLIKQYKPKYNILLKDSKTYPWICVSSEAYPRVYLTRRVEKNGSKYFGPYSSAYHAKKLLEFIRSLYPIRSCNLKIDEAAIAKGKFRPCLDYHLGRCLGCCIGAVSMEDYRKKIDEIILILKGETSALIKDYKMRMSEAAKDLKFELAQVYKTRIDLLSEHYSKSIVSGSADINADVFSLVIDASRAFGNYMRIKNGAVIQSLNLEFRLGIEESQESVLSTFIAEIESRVGHLSREVIVPFLPDVSIEGVEFKIPSRGERLSLLELSLKNAREFHFNSLRQLEKTDPAEFKKDALEQLKGALGMSVLPTHIECFDNSNIQGTNPVASCVVFRDGLPSKKDYRKFKIKTVVGADDYASMYEVVHRRYSRMKEEAPDDLPQLVIIDGGKGQLGFAYRAIEDLGLQNKMVMVGLAKRMEEIVRLDDPYPLFLDRNSQAFRVVTHIRDEAHRFGITFHRSLRSKAQVHSALTSISGVGERTAQRLLMHFGSVPRIASASEEEIAALVGPALAEKIKKELSTNDK